MYSLNNICMFRIAVFVLIIIIAFWSGITDTHINWIISSYPEVKLIPYAAYALL